MQNSSKNKGIRREVYLRYPGKQPRLLMCSESSEDFKGSRQFVLSEFNGSPVTYDIISEEGINDDCTPIDENASLPDSAYAASQAAYSAAKIEYSEQIATLAQELRNKGGKTVIARQIPARTRHSHKELFLRLCTVYPESVVYAWSDGEEWWIGATPEMLLSSDDNTITAMSLAGTRPAGSSEEPWSQKNREEQAIVTRFIVQELRECGLIPEFSATTTHKAGPVEHLCTHITAGYLASPYSPLDIARRLSPTPAVAGWPRERALSHIAVIEDLPRKFYAGFFGLTEGDAMQLHVTLRCLRLFPDGRLTIYAGGGITGGSIAADEWEETCLKAATLLKVIC